MWVMIQFMFIGRMKYFWQLFVFVCCTAIFGAVFLNPATAAEGAKKLRLAYAGWEIGTAVAYIGVDPGCSKSTASTSRSCRSVTRYPPAYSLYSAWIC